MVIETYFGLREIKVTKDKDIKQKRNILKGCEWMPGIKSYIWYSRIEEVF